MSNRDVINQHKLNALMTKQVRAVLKKHNGKLKKCPKWLINDLMDESKLYRKTRTFKTNFNLKFRSKVKIGKNYQAKIPDN
jgi:hypothetical protein|tara:strand:+ start:170 stop:412 length:243 start_codon:yes stop_codon:yes gene_type:complete